MCFSLAANALTYHILLTILVPTGTDRWTSTVCGCDTAEAAGAVGAASHSSDRDARDLGAFLLGHKGGKAQDLAAAAAALSQAPFPPWDVRELL
jgi:hypothetical protein